MDQLLTGIQSTLNLNFRSEDSTIMIMIVSNEQIVQMIIITIVI